MSLDSKLQPFQVLAAAIASEIDLLAKYPDYYAVEDFHLGQDLFHVGP